MSCHDWVKSLVIATTYGSSWVCPDALRNLFAAGANKSLNSLELCQLIAEAQKHGTAPVHTPLESHAVSNDTGSHQESGALLRNVPFILRRSYQEWDEGTQLFWILFCSHFRSRLTLVAEEHGQPELRPMLDQLVRVILNTIQMRKYISCSMWWTIEPWY